MHSSLASVLKAVRALGYELKSEKKGVTITWEREHPEYPGKMMFHSQGLIDERVPEWLNEELEDKGLLKTETEE